MIYHHVLWGFSLPKVGFIHVAQLLSCLTQRSVGTVLEYRLFSSFGCFTVFSTSPNIWHEMPTYQPKHCCIKTLLFWNGHQRGPCSPFQYSRFSLIFQVFECRAFWNWTKSTLYLSYKPIRKREWIHVMNFHLIAPWSRNHNPWDHLYMS